VSFDLVAFILRNFNGPRHAQPVLLALADHADKQGIAWPSVATLAARCRLSERHVTRCISQLVATGWLRSVGSRAGGRALSVRWQIIVNPDIPVTHYDAKQGHPCQGLGTETLTPASANPDTGVQKPRHGRHPKQSGSNQEPINGRATHPRVRSVKSPKRNTETDAAFVAFWQAYPRKTAKLAAVRAWEKLNPDPDTCERIVRQVEAAKQTIDWRKDGGAFVPYPATYLNGRRFDDELGAVTTPQKLKVAL
jgi:hypothetical protein